LQVHQFPKGWIKEIDDGQYKIPGTMNVFSHGGAKVTATREKRKSQKKKSKGDKE
jgi:hypothetical protein